MSQMLSLMALAHPSPACGKDMAELGWIRDLPRSLPFPMNPIPTALGFGQNPATADTGHQQLQKCHLLRGDRI